MSAAPKIENRDRLSENEAASELDRLPRDGGERPLRVLIVHRYYYPDTPPIAYMLRSIAERWAGLGHEVSVFTSQPCYKPKVWIPKQPRRETMGGVDIQRCRLPLAKSRNAVIRVFNFSAFLFFAFWQIVLQWKKFDVVMCLSFPPVVSAAVVSSAAWLRGSSFIYYLLDIHPESSIFAGKLRPAGFLARLARRLDRRSCDVARRVVVLSDDMANTWLDRYPTADRGRQREKMHVIADFNPTDFGDADAILPAEFIKPPQNFRLVFAGNIGQFQAIDNLIRTAHLLADVSDIEFLFIGEGATKAGAIELAGDMVGSTVHFHPHQTVAVADKIMRTADLCVVSLSPNLYRVAFPCKTSSYLAMGCPILVVMEEKSELYRMTVDNNLGFACRGNDPAALRETILQAYNNRDQLERMRAPAKAFAEKHLVPAAVLVKWDHLMRESATAIRNSQDAGDASVHRDSGK